LVQQARRIDAQESQRQQRQQGFHKDMLEDGRQRRQRDSDEDRECEGAGALPSEPGQRRKA
jgi:hypothetical protein